MIKKIFNPVTLYLLFFGFFFFAAIGASLFDSLTEAGLNPIDYARITDVDYKATLVDEPGNGGKVVVTENLTFDIHKYKHRKSIWKYKCLNLLNAYFEDASEADFCKNSVLPHRWQENGIYAILSEQ